jgi:hypothetical protein
MGVIYGNLKQPAKAEESYQKAMKHLDRMTEREKYGTLGGYYLLVSHDYDQAVENYQALVSRYPADRAGHANLAYAYLNKRQMANAVGEVRKSLDLEPGNMLQRMNYAMYSLYAGDFPTAISESRRIPAGNGLTPYALLTEGRAAAASGDLAAAADAYTRLAAAGVAGAAMASLARADLAMYQGITPQPWTYGPAAAAGARWQSRRQAVAPSWRPKHTTRWAGAGRFRRCRQGRPVGLSRRRAARRRPGVHRRRRLPSESVAADLDNRLQAQSRAHRSDRRRSALRQRLPAARRAPGFKQRVDSCWSTC